MATGWTAMRFGWTAYIVPFLFVYSPAILLIGEISDVIIVTVTSLAGIWLICAAMTGYFVRLLGLPMRVAFAVAGIMLMLPHQVSAAVFWANIAGVALGIALVAFEMTGRRRAAAIA